MTPAVRVLIVYDVDLPSRLAAPIQILNTADALAARGVPTTVALGRVDAPDDAAALAPYGLEPRAGLSLVALRGGLGRPATAPGWGSFLRSAAELAARMQATGRGLVVMSRGETGVRLLPVLAAQRDRPVLVYEAYRLGWLRLAQDPAASRLARAAKVWRVPAEWRRERRAADQADGVVANNTGLERAMRRSLPFRGPSLVLPSGTRPAPEDRGAPDIDIVFASKLEQRKGIGVLLEAMSHLPDATLHVLGGSEAEVEAGRRQAERLDVAGRVRFEGFVEPAQVGHWLRRARVGPCPLMTGVERSSERYTSSLKALELMARGVPVVATDVPAMRELVGPDGDAALLVPPNDPAALAAAMHRVLSDADLAARLSRAGRRRAEGFSWERRAERLHRFLESLEPPPSRGI